MTSSAIDFYVAFQLWRTAIIIEGVYARYLGGAYGGQQLGAELDILRDSPVELVEQAQAALARPCHGPVERRAYRTRVVIGAGTERARRGDHDRPYRSTACSSSRAGRRRAAARAAPSSPNPASCTTSVRRCTRSASPRRRCARCPSIATGCAGSTRPSRSPIRSTTTRCLLERSVDATSARLGADGKAWTSLFAPVVDGGFGLVDDVLSPLSLPRHPITMARFGLHALRSAAALRRARFVGDRGCGAVRRGRCPCDPAARPAGHRRCRTLPRRPRPRRRLATGGGRFAGDRRRPRRRVAQPRGRGGVWAAGQQPRRVAPIHGGPRRRRAAQPRGHRR